ncbi:MAG: biliverdin-producing heme oxygenase [Pseudomonadota bacterium]
MTVPLTPALHLRAATADRHTALEAQPLLAALMAAGLTRARYAQLLNALHGFFAPLEDRLTATHPALLAELGYIARTPLLRTDLTRLGHPHSPMHCTALPPVDDKAQALGVLYVLEGSRLGGAVIARHLRQHAALEVGDALCFYESDGEALAPRWRGFTAALDARLASPETLLRATEAACATFSALTDWLSLLEASDAPQHAPQPG